MIFADVGSEINETQEVTSLMGKTNFSNYVLMEVNISERKKK